MARTTRWHYTVIGTGHFPFDMLRYDQAWPEDAGHELAPMMHDHKDRLVKREQRLVGLSQPTADRWASFGWYVKADSVRKRTY